MKPFDLEAAKRGEKVVTRDGREFTFGGYKPDTEFPLIGGIGKKVYAYPMICGAYHYVYLDHLNDLFMAPKVKKYWRRLFKMEGDEGHPEYFVSEKDESTRFIDEQVVWLSDWEEFEVKDE